MNSQYDQLPVGLIAQLVEHCFPLATALVARAYTLRWSFILNVKFVVIRLPGTTSLVYILLHLGGFKCTVYFKIWINEFALSDNFFQVYEKF